MAGSENIKSRMRRSTQKSARPRALSTGSSMLNLACTGDIRYGFLTGHYYWFCGDSDSGKTFLCLTCFAEAANNPEFDGYRLIYDAPEGGALMDIERFFGRRVLERLEPPARCDDGTPRHSSIIQEFYFNVDDAVRDGRPFVYVLDSHDCLSSKEEATKFDEIKKAYRRGKEKKLTGTYGDGKAKFNSANLRKLMGPLESSGSILIVISQTRDSFSMFESGSASGGRALKFYATLQLWSTQAGKIKRNVRGKDRQLGINAKVRVKKNRATGRDRSVLVPIYHSVGIDDTGSMVDYLISEGVWKAEKGVVTVTGLGPEFTAKYESLIRQIEDEDRIQDLKDLTESTWQEIEQACEVERRRRYE